MRVHKIILSKITSESLAVANNFQKWTAGWTIDTQMHGFACFPRTSLGIGCTDRASIKAQTVIICPSYGIANLGYLRRPKESRALTKTAV